MAAARSLEETIAAARLGDTEAFRVLVERYWPRCMRIAERMLGNAQDAEETVQDTFVRVHRALPNYREQQRFEPWLFRILGNRCRSRLVTRRAWRDTVTLDESFDAPVTGLSEAEAHAWRDAVERAMGGLPPEQREAFLLRHVEGLEYEEMMQVTGAGLSALKMRVKRACDALRRRLEDVIDAA
ncbi:MAG: RNA polymerase sigma factor [Gemmatimonadales bacterium]|nr:RNA polymerase sigma factor [Gemmatimonadales bacterium]